VETAGEPTDVLGLVGSTIEQVRFDACVDGGGFGLIYRGYHEGLGEAVAIKVLRIATLQRAPEEIREGLAGRFRDETKLLYRLSQGNLDIVRCIGSGAVIAPKTNELVPYMVLEWLEGQTLGAELEDRRARGLGGRSLEEAEALLRPAASGIAYAHANDVVHRDLKPGNLFLTRTREGVRLKVLDFGLAKILSDESLGVRPSVETQAGVHLCSPAYGAPEQFSARVGKLGPATDVYSLALVFLELLLGAKVRPARSLAEGLMKALDPATGSPTATQLGLALPAPIEALLTRAVAQNPQDRPADVGVFWTALKEAMSSVPREELLRTRESVPPASIGSDQPPPFAGTMLMPDAPRGAPHLPPRDSPVPSASALPLFQGPIIVSRVGAAPAHTGDGPAPPLGSVTAPLTMERRASAPAMPAAEARVVPSSVAVIQDPREARAMQLAATIASTSPLASPFASPLAASMAMAPIVPHGPPPGSPPPGSPPPGSLVSPHAHPHAHPPQTPHASSQGSTTAPIPPALSQAVHAAQIGHAPPPAAQARAADRPTPRLSPIAPAPLSPHGPVTPPPLSPPPATPPPLAPTLPSEGPTSPSQHPARSETGRRQVPTPLPPLPGGEPVRGSGPIVAALVVLLVLVAAVSAIYLVASAQPSPPAPEKPGAPPGPASAPPPGPSASTKAG